MSASQEPLDRADEVQLGGEISSRRPLLNGVITVIIALGIGVFSLWLLLSVWVTDSVCDEPAMAANLICVSPLAVSGFALLGAVLGARGASRYLDPAQSRMRRLLFVGFLLVLVCYGVYLLAWGSWAMLALIFCGG